MTGRSGHRPGPTLALVLACVLWGSAFYFGKVALAEMGPVHLTLYRFGLAAPVLAVVALKARARPSPGEILLLVVTGILCVPASFLVQFEGLARTSVANASLVIGTATPLLALAGTLFNGERLGRRGWAAVGLSTVGLVGVVGAPSDGGGRLGDGLVFVSIVLAVVWIMTSQRLARRLGSAAATAWILLLGTLFLAPVSLALAGPPPLDLGGRTWAALAALGLGCTVAAFGLWNWGAARYDAGRAGVFINLEPVVGVGLGVALLGETVTPVAIGGGALILGAAVLASIEPVANRAAAGADPALDDTPSLAYTNRKCLLTKEPWPPSPTRPDARSTSGFGLSPARSASSPPSCR